MSKSFSLGEVNLDVTVGRQPSRSASQPVTPFRIAVLGNFSGQCDASRKLGSRHPILLDRDNFDDVLARLGVALSLPLDGAALTLPFAELDDFHPDRIFERAAIFQKLRRMRDRLADPATFAQVLAEIGLTSATPPAEGPATPTVPSGGTPASVDRLVSGNLLEQAVVETQGQTAGRMPSRAPDELRAFVQRIVVPNLVAKADPRQAEMMSALDRATSGLMRALLHLPDFQLLESAWRALFFLVRRVETSERLKIYLMDVSKAELAADLVAAEGLHSAAIWKLLVEQTVGTPGAEPWAVLAGNYTFEPTREDADLLARLAKVAQAAGAPFLAAASPRLLGCQSASEMQHRRDWESEQEPEATAAWTALRKLPEASYVSLALPRFLLRLPYGKETDRTEVVDFEEMPQTPVHEDYLWGNPAFACAVLLAQAFSEEGWQMRPGTVVEIDGLPVHCYKESGEMQAKPCAEVLLTEDAIEGILDQGLMPFASLKGRDAARLVRFQSIAYPLKALAGRWG